MGEFPATLFARWPAISGALELFHSMETPWWLSSVFPTVSVRSALFPLMVRQTKSMRARQELKPEMAETRAKYETDRHKQQEAVMELYRKLASLLALLSGGSRGSEELVGVGPSLSKASIRPD